MLASKPESSKANPWSLEDWIHSAVRSLDFGSFESAQKSSQSLLDEISKLQLETLNENLVLVQEFDFSDLSHDIQMNSLKVDQKKSLKQDPLPPMNNIQGLVKRRKV